MVTIKEVAGEAGVSVATVSRVISGSGKVSSKKKKQVLQAIEILNYKPNAVARNLRTAKTKMVLVAVPNINNPFFSEVLTGIQKTALQQGYHVLLFDTDHDFSREAKFLEMLEQKQVDGLILCTAQVTHETLRKVEKSHPIVMACEYLDGEDFSTVLIDNRNSARKVIHHLIEAGYRRIAHITGPLNTVLGIDRLRGYKEALAEHNLLLSEWYIREGDFSFESGYQLMTQFLMLANPPDAIFAGNDEMALGAIKAIQSKNLSVPEDIGVVGFDNIKMASIFKPALTTIAQPAYQIGTTAMEVLVEKMEGSIPEQRHFIIEDRLIVRESSVRYEIK
ncbi:LacI family DNA-binding transcriptional regulator [Gracilibacillus phocaeensis]|uniref:LacI family DNA-binding transcriptional regulator n=1 Tax=Gracilibacillus phocaeensis TaxID=2042304 RepID=UPI00103127B1|nr:LacI family DNA-binding transcriptional regulator [Gracilibacillus phocaeensis]